MYQNNLKTYYNRHYGKAQVLNSPSAMLQKNNKKMLEEDSDDEFISHNSKEDHESRLNEQKFGRILFLVTVVILLVKLFKLTSASLQSTDPRQWWSGVKFPDFRMDWQPEGVAKLLSPVLWASGVTVMTWIMIYFDSKVPGVNPHMPTKKQLLNPFEWPMAYWTSVFCGFFVLLTMVLLGL